MIDPRDDECVGEGWRPAVAATRDAEGAEVRHEEVARGVWRRLREAQVMPQPVVLAFEALVLAVLAVLRFWAMNFSVASYASSSTICTGGDFIR
jgi:hypothetical protein